MCVKFSGGSWDLQIFGFGRGGGLSVLFNQCSILLGKRVYPPCAPFLQTWLRHWWKFKRLLRKWQKKLQGIIFCRFWKQFWRVITYSGTATMHFHLRHKIVLVRFGNVAFGNRGNNSSICSTTVLLYIYLTGTIAFSIMIKCTLFGFYSCICFHVIFGLPVFFLHHTSTLIFN